jgi:DNA processing protein
MCNGSAHDDSEDWLLLYRTPGVGAVVFNKLLRALGTPGNILNASKRVLAELGVSSEIQRGLRTVCRASVAEDLRWLDGADCHLITLADERYPSRLREIPDPPPLLFVTGDPRWLSEPQIAIVGSRMPSRAGAEIAHEFSSACAERGVVVTSGLAHGIDAQAHRGCLAARGATVAVTGTGPEAVYPRAHRALAGEVAAHGAVATEFPTNSPVRPENFPRRNRIISGLSLGVLVVEAAEASGSLITARHALDQGRDVFAVPGSIRNPLTRGCHALIKQGAKLVERIEDVLEEFPQIAGSQGQDGVNAKRRDAHIAAENERAYACLLEALGYDAAPVDLLVSRTGLTANQVSSMLLTLELEGVVALQAGGLYIRLRPERS